MNNKIIGFLVMLLLVVGVASAYGSRLVMNPFTDDLDYTIKANMSGEDIVADTGTFENITVTEDADIKDLLADNLEQNLDGEGYNLTIESIFLGNSTAGILDAPTNTYVRVGDAGTTSHGFDANDDLFVSGKLEVDGNVYFDAYALFNRVQIDSSKYVEMDTYADDGFRIGVGADSGFGNRNLIICDDSYISSDFDHETVASDPTVWIHSGEDPDTDNTEWLSIAYSSDLEEGQIGTGKQDLTLAGVNDTNIKGDVMLDSDLYVGDEDNYELLDINSNGTHVLFDGGSSALDFMMLPHTGAITQIGDAGTTDHSLNANDDLYVTGDLEVDGTAWLDSAAYVGDSFILSGGGIYWNGAGATYTGLVGYTTTDEMKFGLGTEQGRQFIITDKSNVAKDHDHATTTDPTTFFHSVTSPDDDNTEWGSVAYVNSTDKFTITTGKGDISLDPVSSKVYLPDDVNVTWDNGAMIGVNSTCLILSSPDGSGVVNVCNT